MRLLITTLCVFAMIATFGYSHPQVPQTKPPGSEKTHVHDDVPSTNRSKVGKQKCAKNGDGVQVCVGNKGKMVLTPGNGNGASKTKVIVFSDTQGAIKGIDHNDTVEVGPKSDLTIEGTGGDVVITGAGSNLTVSNTSTGSTGGAITVHVNGATFNVGPGSTVTVSN